MRGVLHALGRAGGETGLDDSADPDAFVSAPRSARLLRELNGGDVSAK